MAETSEKRPRQSKKAKENSEATPRKPRKPQDRQKVKETAAMDVFLGYLKDLNPGEPTASIHVNGHQFTTTSIITVDFGQPLKPVRLTSDQQHLVGEHLRAATKELLGREVQVRVHSDPSHGVMWSSLN